jgi:hypothetical protein
MNPLMRAVLLLLVVSVGSLLHAQDPAPTSLLGEKVRIEDEVLARWERVSTQVTGNCWIWNPAPKAKPRAR